MENNSEGDCIAVIIPIIGIYVGYGISLYVMWFFILMLLEFFLSSTTSGYSDRNAFRRIVVFMFCLYCADNLKSFFDIYNYNVSGIDTYLMILLFFWVFMMIHIFASFIDVVKGGFKISLDSIFLCILLLCFVAISIFLFGLYHLDLQTYKVLNFRNGVYPDVYRQSFSSFFLIVSRRAFVYTFEAFWEVWIVKIAVGLFIASLIFLYVTRIIKFALSSLFPNKY